MLPSRCQESGIRSQESGIRAGPGVSQQGRSSLKLGQETIRSRENQLAHAIWGRGWQQVPLVFEVIEAVHDAEPGIGGVAMRLVDRPGLAASSESMQLGDEALPVTMARGQARVTHLVNQDAPFGPG